MQNVGKYVDLDVYHDSFEGFSLDISQVISYTLYKILSGRDGLSHKSKSSLPEMGVSQSFHLRMWP